MSLLHRQHVQTIFHYIYCHVGDKHAAEELTEEVSLRAIEESLIFESWEILHPAVD